MNTANNQLHRETEKRLREALLQDLEQERVPSVGQLCERAGINRSTFYRHYADVYALMETVEREIQHGLYQSIADRDSPLADLSKSPALLESLLVYVGQNRHFYRVYLSRGDAVFAGESFQYVWEHQFVPMFQAHHVENEAHMRYYYEYIRAGFVALTRRWLENGCVETPAELAGILYHMLPGDR